MRRLCVLEDVKRYVQTAGRWTDDEIWEEIEEQTNDIYQEHGDPLAAIRTTIDKDSTANDTFYLKYYVGEKRLFDIERVFVGTVTKRELTGSDYEVGKNIGMLKFNTSTVGGSRLDESDDMLIYYVPNMYAKYCALRVAESLLEKLDMISGGNSSRELEVIRKRLIEQDRLMNQRVGILFSSDQKYYNTVYGVNLKKVTQNHDMNEYIWKEDSVDD